MRKFAVVGLAVLGLFAVAGIAFAANNTVSYSSKLKKNKKAGGATNATYTGILAVRANPPGTQPDVAPNTDDFFDKALKNNGAKFPSPCKKSDIDGKNSFPTAKCRKGIVGSGTAVAYGGTAGGPLGVRETLSVKALNANHGGSLYLVVDNPNGVVPIHNRVIDGKFRKLSGVFGFRITFLVPPNLQKVAGVPVALTDFNVQISGTKTVKIGNANVSYLQLTKCPRNHKLQSKAIVHFANGQSVPSPSTYAC